MEKEPNVSKARNLGASKASFNNLIFLDADTLMHETDLKKIQKSLEKGIVGTCKVKPDVNKLTPRVLMKLKNLLLFTYWSCGLIFCNKEVWNKVNGFDETKKTSETKDFMRKCSKHGKFKIANTHVTTSMRRFEQTGYLKNIFYWIQKYSKLSKEDYPIIR